MMLELRYFIILDLSPLRSLVSVLPKSLSGIAHLSTERRLLSLRMKKSLFCFHFTTFVELEFYRHRRLRMESQLALEQKMVLSQDAKKSKLCRGAGQIFSNQVRYMLEYLHLHLSKAHVLFSQTCFPWSYELPVTLESSLHPEQSVTVNHCEEQSKRRWQELH
jgi:hypothetical protein